MSTVKLQGGYSTGSTFSGVSLFKQSVEQLLVKAEEMKKNKEYSMLHDKLDIVIEHCNETLKYFPEFDGAHSDIYILNAPFGVVAMFVSRCIELTLKSKQTPIQEACLKGLSDALKFFAMQSKL